MLVLGAVGLLASGLGGSGAEPLYHTAPVERGDLTTTITASGTIRPLVTVDVGSQLSGQIAELLADFNDQVTQGQPLARLDARSFEAKVREERAAVAVARATVLIEEAAVEKAAATLANTKALQVVLEAETAAAQATFVEAGRNLERKQKLAKKSGAVAQTDLDAAVARRDAHRAGVRAAQARVKAHDTAIETVAAAQRMASAKLENARAQVAERQAELEQAQVELARTTIRAPIDGVIIGRNVDLGQTVAASLEAPTVFTIAQDLSDMELHASTDEADIGSVRVGQQVSFTVDAHPNQRFAGEVIQIRKAPRYLENVVVYTVVISAANPELLLLPGMTATARIVVSQVSDVLKVPGAALRFDPPEDAPVAARPEDGDQDLPDWVWVLDDDGLPSAVRVSLGARDASVVQVTGGTLAESQTVIVNYTTPAEETTLFGLRLGF